MPFCPAAPPPVYALAVHTADRKDDVKLSAAFMPMHPFDNGEMMVRNCR